MTILAVLEGLAQNLKGAARAPVCFEGKDAVAGGSPTAERAPVAHSHTPLVNLLLGCYVDAGSMGR